MSFPDTDHFICVIRLSVRSSHSAILVSSGAPSCAVDLYSRQTLIENYHNLRGDIMSDFLPHEIIPQEDYRLLMLFCPCSRQLLFMFKKNAYSSAGQFPGLSAPSRHPHFRSNRLVPIWTWLKSQHGSVEQRVSGGFTCVHVFSNSVVFSEQSKNPLPHAFFNWGSVNPSLW